MAPTLLSPATVSHHHATPSLLTATYPFVPLIHFFSPCGVSTSKIISSHRWSPLPPRTSKLRRGQCGAASPHPPSPPESEPPPDDDQSSNSGSIASLSRFQEVSRFFVLFFSGCLSSFGHLYGTEGIKAGLIRDLDSGNE